MELSRTCKPVISVKVDPSDHDVGGVFQFGRFWSWKRGANPLEMWQPQPTAPAAICGCDEAFLNPGPVLFFLPCCIHLPDLCTVTLSWPAAAGSRIYSPFYFPLCQASPARGLPVIRGAAVWLGSQSPDIPLVIHPSIGLLFISPADRYHPRLPTRPGPSIICRLPFVCFTPSQHSLTCLSLLDETWRTF